MAEDGSTWESWSPADVSRWVADTLGMPQYADAFAIHEVDGPTLLELTDETLEDPLGISEALKRKKILGHVKLLKVPNDVRDERPTPLSRNQRLIPQSDTGSAGQSTPRMRSSGAGRISSSGQAHRVSRNRSTASTGNKAGTPRSVSASSDRSLECASSMKSLDEGSLYSDFRNPNHRMTNGLLSNFGIDSPSFSRTGSFPNSCRNPKVFPGVPVTYTPGPDCYTIPSANRMLRAQPRGTIGRSARNTVEYVVPASPTPGVGKYDPPALRSKGVSFPTSPRMPYSKTQVRSWLSPRAGPGPCDYRPQRTYDSTFRA